jgi:isopenicillin N synthase-like dioxygenase
MGLGTENTAGKVDLREQVEFANEEEGAGMTGWPPYERLRGRNPWPDGCQPSLKHTTLAYVARVVEVADVIRGALCSILRLDRGVAESLFGSDASDDDGASEGEKPHWVLKLVAYPPVDPSTILPGSFGVGPHTDTNFLTVILQDGVGGLQVHSKGQWIDVPADEEGVLVCNLGEQAEILSRGYFRATPHRVLPNTTCTTRVSVPLFYNPRLSATVAPQPLPKDLEWESDREGKDSDAGHWRMKHNVMLATVGDNTFKSLARSHPAVFRRHHGDLQQLEDGRVVRRND